MRVRVGAPVRIHRVRWLGALCVVAAMAYGPSIAMADDLPGGPGDDHIDGTSSGDTIDGKDGNDTLDGHGGDDTVTGGSGDDSVHGGDDDDTVAGDTIDQPGPLVGGNDPSVLGTAGDDTVYGDGTTSADAASGDTPDLSGGNDIVEGDAGTDQVHGDGKVDAGSGGKAVLDGGDDHIWGESPGGTLGSIGDIIYGDGIATGDLGALLLGGDDVIQGGANDDFIVGDGYADDIGDDQQATVDGGDDQIDGGAGNDTIYGDGGADGPDSIASVLGGNDTVHGGDGNDFIWGEGINYAFVPTGGDDHLFGEGGIDTIYGQSGNDTIDGGDDSDVVAGEALGHSEGFTGGNDSVAGGSGADQVYGDGSVNSTLAAILDGGDDTSVDGGDGDDDVYGDGSVTCGGLCTLLGGNELSITGGDGDDFISGDGGVTTSNGGDGHLTGGSDVIDGGAGSNAIHGDGSVSVSGAGSDAILVGGNDTISNGGTVQGDGLIDNFGAGGTSVLNGGDDTIAGSGNGDGFIRNHDGTGDATLNGGDDTISGRDVADVIYGDGQVHNSGTGSALLNGGDDTIDAGGGDDKVVGDGWINAGALTQLITGGDDVLHGGEGNDTLWGESGNVDIDQTMVGGNDLLYGDAGNDTIYGQTGDDALFGGDGDDVLDGGSGNDLLCGGSGTNTLKGGSGSDLRCAVDDSIQVTAKGGALNVSINEKLDDESSEDRAGRRYEIVSISPNLKAVMDAETGRLTIISADGDGQIEYRVYLLDGGLDTAAIVFVSFLATPPPPPEPDPEPTTEPTTDPTQAAPIVVPVVNPTEAPIEPAPDASVDPIGPDVTRDHPVDPAESPVEGIDDPIQYGKTHKSDSIKEFFRGPLAPAVTVGVAGTVMTSMAGGAGMASQSLSSARGGGTSGGGAVGRAEGTSDRFASIARGIGPGDRSITWRSPGWRWLDKISVTVPHRLAPFSPLMARLGVDGSEIRAMFGSLWLLTAAAGVYIGGLAAYSVGAVALPPPLWILVAGAILTTFDALAGAIASTVFIGAGVLSGAMFNEQSPDLVHSLLVYCGVGFLWTSIPLIGSAMRPFRRIGEGSVRHFWDVTADLAIASLLCAWVTRGLMSSMDSFAGQPTGLTEHANLIALVVLGSVALRIVTENAATKLYPLRLQAVEASADFPDPTLLSSFGGIALRTFLFAFIGHSFVGNCWQFWAGTALYCAPQILGALGTKFERVEMIQKLMPRGVTALLVTLLIAAGVVKLVSVTTTNDLETVRWVFMLLAVPPLVFAVLESFTTESSTKTSWAREFLGLGVVVATAWLAFNGWSM